MGELITCTVSDNLIRIKVNENVQSVNAPEFQAKMDAALSSVPHESVEFDFFDVEYISSAGLRVLLSSFNREKAAGHPANAFSITGVKPAVYEIFEMTGFSTIFRVSKAMRKITLASATKIGDGFFSQVYRIDEENIIKVYNENATDEDIRRELDRAKYAMILGIPTAISYDIVEADGRKGVLFEMMNCGTLRDALRDHPEQEEELLDQYAELLRKLHSGEDTACRLPDARAQLLEAQKKVSVYLTEDEQIRIRQLLEGIPETCAVIHGDCHVKNIMLHNGEPELIDLDTLSRGDPVIELGNIYYVYSNFETLWPGNTEQFIGITAELGKRIRDGLLTRYFNGISPEAFDANMNRIRFMSWYRMLCFATDFKRDQPEIFPRILQYLRENLEKTDTLILTYADHGVKA